MHLGRVQLHRRLQAPAQKWTYRLQGASRRLPNWTRPWCCHHNFSRNNNAMLTISGKQLTKTTLNLINVKPSTPNFWKKTLRQKMKIILWFHLLLVQQLKWHNEFMKWQQHINICSWTTWWLSSVTCDDVMFKMANTRSSKCNADWNDDATGVLLPHCQPLALRRRAMGRRPHDR